MEESLHIHETDGLERAIRSSIEDQEQRVLNEVIAKSVHSQETASDNYFASFKSSLEVFIENQLDTNLQDAIHDLLLLIDHRGEGKPFSLTEKDQLSRLLSDKQKEFLIFPYIDPSIFEDQLYNLLKVRPIKGIKIKYRYNKKVKTIDDLISPDGFLEAFVPWEQYLEYEDGCDLSILKVTASKKRKRGDDDTPPDSDYPNKLSCSPDQKLINAFDSYIFNPTDTHLNNVLIALEDVTKITKDMQLHIQKSLTQNKLVYSLIDTKKHHHHVFYLNKAVILDTKLTAPALSKEGLKIILEHKKRNSLDEVKLKKTDTYLKSTKCAINFINLYASHDYTAAFNVLMEVMESQNDRDLSKDIFLLYIQSSRVFSIEYNQEGGISETFFNLAAHLMQKLSPSNSTIDRSISAENLFDKIQGLCTQIIELKGKKEKQVKLLPELQNFLALKNRNNGPQLSDNEIRLINNSINSPSLLINTCQLLYTINMFIEQKINLQLHQKRNTSVQPVPGYIEASPPPDAYQPGPEGQRPIHWVGREWREGSVDRQDRGFF